MVESTSQQLTTKEKALQDVDSQEQNEKTAEDKKKQLAVAAVAAVQQVMSESTKKGKQKLSEVLKAVKAAKLTQDDAAPSPVILLTKDGSLKLATLPQQEAFIYQGSVGCAYNQKELLSAGITHILTCAVGIKQKFPKGFKYESLNLFDTSQQNIIMFFEKAHKFINQCKQENGRVLIHCFAGKSRASTITLSYMMKEMSLDLRTALDHLQKQRPIAQPNVGFKIQLRQYERDIFGTNSDVPITLSLVEREKFKLAGRSLGEDEQLDEHEFLKGLKTTEELQAEGANLESDEKQLSDADELIKKEDKHKVSDTVA